MKNIYRYLSAALLAILLVQAAPAATPQKIKYQGVLKESGQAVTGARPALFRITSSDGATEYWNSGAVTVNASQGLFTYVLSLASLDFSGGPYYLEVSISGQVLLPREEIASTAYALRAATADSVPWSALTGVPPLGGALTQGSVGSYEIADGTVTNSDVASNAAIAYSKLNLAGQIRGTDLADGVYNLPASTFTVYSLAVSSFNFSSLSGNGSGLYGVTRLGIVTEGSWNADTIAVNKGGTGQTAAPANGQLLVGNAGVYAPAYLSASGGLSAAAGAGSLALSLDIPGLSEAGSVTNGDYLLVYSTGSLANKKITRNNLFGDVLGALNYQGTWDAGANSPALSSGAGSKGYYYVVSAAGAAVLDGISSWAVNDWAVFNGTSWQRVQSTNNVNSVFGRTGTISASNNDYTAAQIANAPAGGLAAVTAQAAIDELDAEKLAQAGGAMTGPLTIANATGTITGKDASGYSLYLSSGINMPAGTVNAGLFVGSGAGLSDIAGVDSAVRVSTGAIKLQADNIALSTGALTAQADAIAVSTGVIRTDLDAVILSTGVINSDLAAVALSTGTLVKRAGDTMTGALTIANATGTITGIDSSGYSLYLSSGLNMSAGTAKAKYFVGDGSLLTNLPVGGAANLAVQLDGVNVSSPTAAVSFAAANFNVTAGAGNTGNVSISTAPYSLLAATAAYAADGTDWGVRASTGALTAQAGAIAVSTGVIRTDLAAVILSTGVIRSDLAAVALSTGAIKLQADNIALSTGALTLQADNIALSTGALTAQADAIAVSTGVIRTDLDAVILSTGVIRTDLAAVALSTGTLVKRAGDTMTGALTIANATGTITGKDASGYSLYLSSGINMPAGTVNAGLFVGSGAGLSDIMAVDSAVRVSTGVLTAQADAIAVSTGAIQSQVDSIALSTGTLVTLGTGQTVSGVKTFTSSVTVTASGFSVGGSTLVVANGNVGIGTSSPASKLVVTNGASGGTAISNSIGVYENNSSAYLSLLTPNAAESGVIFANPSSNVAGSVLYNSGNAENGLDFRVNGNSSKVIISSGGQVGIGVASPARKLHVYGTGATNGIRIEDSAAGDEAKLEFLRTGAGNTDAKLYASGSFLRYAYSSNDGSTWTDSLQFGNGTITSGVGELHLNSTGNNAVRLFSNGSERMRVGGTGYIAVGGSFDSNSPLSVYTDGAASGSSGKLQVVYAGNTSYRAGFQVNSSGQLYVALTNDAWAGVKIAYFNLGDSAWSFASDERLKKNITTLGSGLNKVLAIRPVEFDWKDGSGRQAGFIAQEMQPVVPLAVSTMGKTNSNDETEYLGVSKETLIPYMVKAIQEQQAQIEALKTRLSELEGK